MNEAPSGDRNIPPIERIEIDEAKYQQMAENLFREHKEAILTHPDNQGGSEIEDVLREFSDDVLHNYYGHGVTRGDIVSQIAAALSMLDNNVFFGSTARLRGSGYADAYAQGSFFAISRKGRDLAVGTTERKPQRVQATGSRKVGLRMEAGAFVCNGTLTALVAPLRALFPNANVLSAQELRKYIDEQEKI